MGVFDKCDLVGIVSEASSTYIREAAMTTKKKVVVLRPFHEVAFEMLEQGRESEAHQQVDRWLGGYGGDAVLVVAFLLTRCIVPEKEQSRIVPALIAAAKGIANEAEMSKAIAFALAHFKPGKKGLKELGKLLSAEYLKLEDGTDEIANLHLIFEELGLEVPERPAKEEAKKVAPKKPAKGGGKKKPKSKKPLTR